MYKCICIDDEPLARLGLETALRQYEQLELVASFASGIDAITDCPDNIDVMFIDIEMPMLNGFETLQRWPGKLPIVIFVTAYDQYAIKAFEHDALDYVLKPIQELQFARVVEKINKQLSHKQAVINAELLQQKIAQLAKNHPIHQKQISVKTDDGYFSINSKDILWLESVNDHVCIKLSSRELIVRSTLKQFIAELQDAGFEQIHRSYVVNESQVKKISRAKLADYEVEMSNGETLRMSRRYKSLYERFKQ